MKKIYTNILILATLLITGVAFTACSSSDDSIVEQQPANPGEQVYTLTIKASKDGSATTRALALDGTKLVAKWADGDELSVFKANSRTGCTPANLLGTISPVAGSISADGAKATFKGTLTGTVSNGDKLMLVYHPAAFAITGFEGQTGTLASASALDCATALVTASVSGSDITISETSATFTTHTAILKLTLTTDGTTTINPSELKMSMSAGDVTLKEFTFTPATATYTANGDGILYFALPSAEDFAAGLSTPSNPITTTQLAAATITYTATVGSDTYKITKTGYPFAAGKYYTSTLTTRKLMTYDLGAITGNLTLNDGDTATGTLDVAKYPVKISIEAGATVTLNNVTINGTKNDSYKWAGITCLGDATIILSGANTVKGFHQYYPGIHIPTNKTLTIQGETAGTGQLIASSNGKGAGIGGGYEIDCGNITISGGTVEATGGASAAGIGSGYEGTCGNITISGSGNLTATGGSDAAGIGSGFEGECGNITISGGTVTATGGTHAAGIGTGYNSSGCGAITITKGITKVTATKGDGINVGSFNCIGSGEYGGTVGTITIDDKTDWTAGTATTNLNFVVSETYYTNDTWTLTPKSTH